MILAQRQARPGQDKNAGHCCDQSDDICTGDPGAEKYPTTQDDENRCDIRQQRGIGHSGHLDGVMPHRNIGGEIETRHSDPKEITQISRLFCAFRVL